MMMKYMKRRNKNSCYIALAEKEPTVSQSGRQAAGFMEEYENQLDSKMDVLLFFAVRFSFYLCICSKIIPNRYRFFQKNKKKRERVVFFRLFLIEYSKFYCGAHFSSLTHSISLTTQVDVDTCALQKSKHPVFRDFFVVVVVLNLICLSVKCNFGKCAQILMLKRARGAVYTK